MTVTENILAELTTRLEQVANASVEQGFFANYQEETLRQARLLVIQVRSDGPCVHNAGGYKSTLNVLVFGALEFNEQANTLLQVLLKETRQAIFPKGERFIFKRLASTVKEVEPTPLQDPTEGQGNAYFILPLAFEYIETI
jgi:hypothetical protein